MRREIKRLEINDGVHVEGLGNLSSPLPMAFKSIPLKMYYDSSYPTMILLESKGHSHFISMSTVKSGTFLDEPSGNIL